MPILQGFTAYLKTT